MTRASAEGRALRPLWMLASGGGAAAAACALAAEPGPRWIGYVLVLAGAGAAMAALVAHPTPRPALWLLAGLCLVGGRGLDEAAARADRVRQLAADDPAVRVRAVVEEGWTASRWGHRTLGRVLDATLRDRSIDLGNRAAIEVRGRATVDQLPAPGAEISTLARVRGSPTRPMLVVSTPKLLETSGGSRPLPRLREWLVQRLWSAAGTEPRRIRAAQVAAGLAVGRRDVMPSSRRETWRRSGLAHLFAVSGLHVGVVGGAVWLVAAWSGASPTASRVAVLIALPAYALLTGASPSVRRAATMGVLYLAARLLGRAVIPMAAVLAACFLLLLISPSLIVDPGFQLTVVITAALVRWVPSVTAMLPGSPWVSGAVAVPIVAQLAAAPLVVIHFRSLIPGALIANLAALPLIAPTVLLSVVTTVAATVTRTGAALGLEMVHLLTAALSWVSAPARSIELVAAKPPVIAVLALIAAGWFALQSGRLGRSGAACWTAILILSFAAQWRPPAAVQQVELLPVSDGAAVLLQDGRHAALVDAGRFSMEAARMLADRRHHALDAVFATHTDEDHIGGMRAVLRTARPNTLLLPAWMRTNRETVPLLREARRTGTEVRPLARGASTTCGSLSFDTLWPPLEGAPARENERSLVLRAFVAGRRVLLTSDIGQSTELRVARRSSLASDVLVVPHHGSRGSCSSRLLSAAGAGTALIPAASGNRHGHPHPEVIERLETRGIETRWPARDGACGARFEGSEWIIYP